MAKGVKKIKRLSNSYELDNYYNAGEVICIDPNQEASFLVGEWYSETTEEEKRRNISWLWMDQKKTKIFNKTIKPAGVPYGVTIPRKLCGNYAFYLEVGLYDRHDERNTGLYAFGKCEKKITSSSWSKKENTADNGEINYGHDLFISLETEGVNGETLTLESYSAKKTTTPIQTVKIKCINGALKAKFTTMSCFMAVPGLPSDLENFYIKVLDITGEYLKTESGNDKIVSFTIKNKRVMPVFEPPTNTTPLTVDNTPKEEEIKTEGIITAYFAKEEFSLETAEVADQFEYKFKTRNVNIDKDKIAAIIKKNVDVQVKADKKYAKLDEIKNALTENTYGIGDPVTFNLYKLGANYIKINSAPLEEEVYVVAKTFLLDGKEVTITIQEKEAVLVDENANVPVLEAKEDGAELTTLKATVENGIAKLKVKLRPKADEDLKEWKEKLLKGKKEEAYSYTFKNETIITDSNKKQFAAIILNNAKEGKQGNTKIATGKTAYVEDVEKALQSEIYRSGDTISFDTYKTQAESLWLKAECQGAAVKHGKEFLKRDGQYFVIGKKCECEARVRAFMRMLRVGEGTNKEEGYTKQFSGKQFSDMSKHPHEVITASGYSSSAAGAYQIMGDTYDGLKTYRTKYNILNFNQESQDKLCLVILKHNYEKDRPNSFYNPTYWKDDAKTIRDLEKEDIAKERRKRFKGKNGDIVKMLIDNNFDNALLLSALCWASLPDAPYGQPTETKEKCKENYEKFLNEELAGKSTLYLKKGFLKEFGYNCCNNNSGSVKWQNPLKNNQIAIYTFGGSKRPWRSAFGRVRTDMTGTDNGARPHHGLDLFANIGTEVYACLPGEVVSLTPGTGYGNGFVLKIDASYLDEFKKQRRSDYSPYYVKSKRTYDSQKYDITGYGDFEEYEGISESTDVYLMYAHLSEVLVSLNEKITESNIDKVLGKTGTSGATNTKGPHLHFEIRSKQNPSGYAERYNPAFYIDYKNEDQLTDAEREIQDKAMR